MSTSIKQLVRVEYYGVARGREHKERLDLDALLENDLRWAKTGDGDDVSKEALVATRTLTTAAGNEGLVSNRSYVELLCGFAADV